MLLVQEEKAKLKDLHSLVSPHYAVAWKEIGKELNLPIGILNILQKDHPNSSETCCDKMLEEWYSLHPSANWGTILKALDSPKVLAVINSFSNPNVLLQYSETERMTTVSEIAYRLQDYSIENRHKVSEDDWPPFQPTHFTSVAIIHHKKTHSRKEEIEFIASIQHKGQISLHDSIGLSRTIKDYSEIFSKFHDTDKFPKTVLIEGAPGIGKTTLCKELVFQWSTQKLLKDKKLVILVHLRDPVAQHLQSLQEFVKAYCHYTEKSDSIIEEYINVTAGKDMVVVLDGYDELPESVRNNSDLFFVKLIHQKYLELLHCTVLITSRLSVSTELHKFVDRRVEILGFTENNRKEYIMQALENNHEKLEKMLTYFRNNPAINAYCYIPLNMTILLCLFTEGGGDNNDLPSTHTEIHKKFICITISRFITKSKNLTECSVADFKNIPKNIERVFHELCQLAFNTLRDDKIVFSKVEVQSFCKHLAHTENWSGLGLLKAVKFYNAQDNVISTSFNFLHLSLQEALAAYHITLLPKNKQINLLKMSFLNARYFNTWIMYVGLTKGQSFAFKHFLSGNQFQLFTFISLQFNERARISKKLIANKVLCLHLFQCFSEAENDEMCQYVGQLLKDGEIDLSGQTLSAVNIHTLGLFLDRSSIKHWKLLNLSNCFLGSQEIEQLCMFCSNVHIDQLDVSYNNLTQSSVDLLTKMLFIWKMKKAFMHSEDAEKLFNIINYSLRQFSAHKLMRFQSEIFTTHQAILVICMHSYYDIATLSVEKNYYSSIHLISCGIGDTFNETASIVSKLAESSKDIYLHECNNSFMDVLESVVIGKGSSFHFMLESNISSETIRSAIEKLADFAITIGEDVLPLHIFDMTEISFQKVENLIQENRCGTFTFRHCDHQCIVEILSHAFERVTHFTFKKFACLSTKGFSTLFTSNQLLQYMNFSDCKMQDKYLQIMLSFIERQLQMQHVVLTGNNLSNEAAKCLSSSITDMTKLQHLELESCNLHEEGLRYICNAIKPKKLRTLNLNYNCISDQVASRLAQMITENSCIEVIQLSSCSLQFDGMSKILLALAKLKCLKIIDLSHNRISYLKFDVGAVISANAHLEYLNLSYCELKAWSKIKICKWSEVNLKFINISGNCDTETATDYWPELLSNAGCLQHLSLAKYNLHESVLVGTLKNAKNLLNHLDLSYNTITTKAAELVGDVIDNNANFEHLDLSYCSVQDEGLHLILKLIRKAFKLKFIDLTSIPINNVLAGYLAEFISNSVVLDHLSLSNCSLQKEGFLKIVDAFKKTIFLTHLEIGSNYIPSNVMDKLATTNLFGRNSQLVHLNVSQCQWERSSLSKMLVAIMNIYNLKFINCSGCKIDDEACGYICYSITNNSTFEQLILMKCELKTAGLVKIFNALKGIHTLYKLDVSYNKMTSEVIPLLAKTISFNRIEHLNLSHCFWEVNKSDVLTAIANSVTLQYLDLSYNDISDDEASCVASAITNNNNLHHINLTNNQFSTNSIKIILHAMASIDLIHCINLSTYSITEELVVDLEAVAVGNSGLESILLEEYSFYEHAIHLSKSISRLVLKKFSVKNCTVDDTTANYITSVISNSNTISHLDLSFSVIQDLTKYAIIKAIKMQETLQFLSLKYFTVNKAVENEINSLIANRTELQHLELVGCELTEAFLLQLTQVLSSHKKLQHINLSNNAITHKAASDLLSSTGALQSIVMDGCGLKKTVCSSIITTLIKVDLSNNPISDQHVDDVAKLIACNCNLQHLNLSNCAFTSNGVLKITEVLARLKSLVYLNMHSNNISDHLDSVALNVAAIITSNKHIKSLYLPHCILQCKAMNIIFEAICTYFSLKYLDFNDVRVSDQCRYNIRVALTTKLKCTACYEIITLNERSNLFNQPCEFQPLSDPESFYLLEVCISEENISKVFEMLHETQHILLLDIDTCLLSDSHLDDSILLKQSLCMKRWKLNGVILTKYSINHITSIIITNKNIENSYDSISRMSENGVEKFFKTFKDVLSLQNFVFVQDMNTFKSGVSPKYLNFSNSMLQHHEVPLLCEIINSITTIVHINLSHNNISSKAMQLLASGIKKNMSLQHLELARCSLQEESLTLICDVIIEKTMLTINLSYNYISYDVAIKLADVISSTYSIENLQIERCLLELKGIEQIVTGLEKVNTLKTLNLSHNELTNKTLCITNLINSNIQLEVLDLSDCGLDELSIKSKPVNLKVVNLKGNNFKSFTRLDFGQSTYLQTLILSKCNASLDMAFDILIIVKNSLKHLDLSYNVMHIKAARSVANIIQNNMDLEQLNLKKCKLPKEGLSVIIRAVKRVKKLKTVNFTSIGIGDEFAGEVAAVISKNQSLNSLSLSDCAIQEAGFLKITESLLNTNLTHLDVSLNVITNNVAAKLIGNSLNLKFLNISNSDFHESGIQTLLYSITNMSNLRSINFGGCEMNNTDAQLLAASITANDTLEQLILAKCVLQSAGLVSVLDALKKLCTLNHLDLNHIKIDKEIVPLLAEVISGNQIEHLNLSHCSLGVNCTVLSTAIANSVTLQYLNLNYNDISDDEASCLASAITANEYLSHVNLTRNQFSRKSLKMILQAMARIVSLQHVNLSSFVLFGELDGELVEVAKSNPGLESMVMLKENLQLAMLSKVYI